MTTVNPQERDKKNILAVNIGLGANILLALVKTVAGISGNSPALLADGINSTSDVAYGIVVRIFMRLSAKPADEEHPYGHDRLESIATVVVGAFVISTAISIFWSSIDTTYVLLQGKTSMSASRVALFVAIFSILFKIALSVWTRKIGKQINSSMLLVLAADHRNDIFASLAATLGIIGSRAGIPWIDPVAGAVVSGIILFTGIGIIRDATADLMNTVPGEKLKKEIHKTLSNLPEILTVEEISGHRFGIFMVLDITIGINPDLSITKGDQIATEAEEKLIAEVDNIRRVFIHYHPAQNKQIQRIDKAGTYDIQ